MNPTVSIISPSFNSYPYIESNIESVCNLGLPILEHIIMDGGSRDYTIDFLRKVDTRHSVIWRSEKDKGQTHAINKALKVSSGEIIGWLNSDDEYFENILNEIIQIFQNNPDIDIIHGDVDIIDENSSRIGLSKGKRCTETIDLLMDNPIKQPGLFFRRRVFEILGDLNEDLDYVMDREYWLRAHLNGFKFHYVPISLAKFRLIDGTKTFENNAFFRLEWINVLKKYKNSLDVDLVSFNRAISENSGSYHYQTALKKVGFNISFVNRMLRALWCSQALRKNLGFYKVFALGLLGVKRNRYKKYK